MAHGRYRWLRPCAAFFMSDHHAQLWCFTCDNPGWECRGRKGHDVREIQGEPVRARWGEQSVQNLAKTPVSDDRARELFAQWRQSLAEQK